MNTNTAYLIAVVSAGCIIARTGRSVYWRSKRKKITRTYTDKYAFYDAALSENNPYYKSLPEQGRRRFLKRVVVFMEFKEFKYVDLEPEETMPLLISAAAIQLTFGLESFQLDYFDTLYILKDNYRYGLYDKPFEGHVSREGIYLSWSNFIREFRNYSDGQNVGLHEMAHALSYVNFTVEDGMDNAFHDKFKDFSQVGQPLFERMQQGESSLLDPYAATNYQEFWAVCVETFFERPEDFNRQQPELYRSLCELLNQDPLTPDKVLNPTKND